LRAVEIEGMPRSRAPLLNQSGISRRRLFIQYPAVQVFTGIGVIKVVIPAGFKGCGVVRGFFGQGDDGALPPPERQTGDILADLIGPQVLFVMYVGGDGIFRPGEGSGQCGIGTQRGKDLVSVASERSVCESCSFKLKE